MDTTKILQELRQQRDQLVVAIHALERLSLGGAPRRGRPPKWLAAVKSAVAVGQDAGPSNNETA